MSIVTLERKHKRTDEVEVLIPEARARQRRRHHVVGIALVVAAIGGLIAGLLVAFLPSPPSITALQQLFRSAVQSSNQAAFLQIVQINSSEDNLNGPPTTETTYVDPSSGLSRMTETVEGFFFQTTIESRTEAFVRYSTMPNLPVNSGSWFSYPLGVISHSTPRRWGVIGVSGPVTRIGTRVIDGVPSTGYRFTTSVPLLISQSSTKAQQAIYRGAYLDRGVTSFPTQIWISSSGRIREWWWSFKPRDSLTLIGVQIRSYGNTPVHITFPPAGQTTDVLDQAQADRDAYHAAASR